MSFFRPSRGSRLARPGRLARLMRLRMRLRLRGAKRALRDRESGRIVAACLTGAVVGTAIALLHHLLILVLGLVYALPQGQGLSGGEAIPFWNLALIPALGGLVLGLVALWLHRWRPTEIVDPVEANALYGGRMSLADSIRLTGLTFVSNAAGVSVGMEAGYSQLGAGVLSALGSWLNLRREDLRAMTSAGAGAAIAAAFNAPLAGAFYAFELVHGTYTARSLALVGGAAVCATLAVQAFGPSAPLFAVSLFGVPGFDGPGFGGPGFGGLGHDGLGPADLGRGAYLLYALLGLVAAGLGIVTMRATIGCERLFRASPLPGWARPAVGGAILSLLAFGSPQILGSGHGAIGLHLAQSWTVTALLALLIGKVAASALSLGAGFRGGLFSSSLFIGCLLGAVFAQVLGIWDPAILDARISFMLVGMAAVGAAIVGAPFTMAFLVLETTGDFRISLGVLVGVITASVVVRLTFGYSFSTWRFHLRGVPLKGGQDVGWVRDLTAERLMRGDMVTVPQSMPLAELCARFPLGSTKYVFATDAEGRFAGTVDLVSAHDPDLAELAQHLLVADLTVAAQVHALRSDTISEILDRFAAARVEVMPVLDSFGNRMILGRLSETYCARRYAEELERHRLADLGAGPG